MDGFQEHRYNLQSRHAPTPHPLPATRILVLLGNIDWFRRTYRLPGTRFILEAGPYRTSGAWGFEETDFCMIAPDGSLEGDPAGGTTFSMPQPLNRPGAPYYEMITGGDRSIGNSNRMTVQHLTVIPARPRALPFLKGRKHRPELLYQFAPFSAIGTSTSTRSPRLPSRSSFSLAGSRTS